MLERIYNKLYLLSEPYLPGSDKTLCYIHIGKCGGETLLSVIKRSEVIQNRFTTIKKAHIIKPIYQRNMRYLIVVRNPVSRALSAFNWRYKLVVEDKIQEDRFDGEIDILKKYKTLNDLAESLYSEDRLNTDVAKEFRLIHHLKEDISFYLTDLLKKVKAQQIFAVLTQEYLNDDIRNFLGVINNESIHTNRSKMDENRLYLSERALENLKCFLKPDYDALKKLNALYPLEENRLQKLLH